MRPAGAAGPPGPEAGPGPATGTRAEPSPRPPRRPWRAWVLRLHLWLGLSAGTVIAVVGLTGAIYLFQPEVTAWAQGGYYRASGAGEELPARELTRRAEARLGPIHGVIFPQRERETYMFKRLGQDGWHYFDPHTGAYLGENPGKGFFDWVLDIHTSLAMGEVGRHVTGASSLILAFFLLSSGIYLWWPRTLKILKHRLRLDRRASSGRRNFDLHAVGGFYAAPFLALLAITGASFVFPKAYEWAADRLTFSRSTGFDGWSMPSTYRPGVRPLTIYQALDSMAGRFPGYHPRNLWMPGDSADNISFTYVGTREILAGGFYRPIVALDQYTGELLWEYDPRRAPLGQRLLGNWVFPIHFAEIGGLPTRILGFFVSLMPLVLLWSGIRIWRGRARTRNGG